MAVFQDCWEGDKIELMHTLYIDETGTSGLKTIDPKYPFLILAGVVICSNDYPNIDGYSKIIKEKFWPKNPNVVWRFSDLRRRYGAFRELKGNKLSEFKQSLEVFLNDSPFFLFVSIVDKIDFVKSHKKPTDPYRQAFNYLLKRYVAFIKGKGNKGRIVVESRMGQDLSLLAAYHESSQPARVGQIKIYRAKVDDVRERITALSFVKKDNYDIGLQIADVTAYICGVKVRDEKGIKKMLTGSYEEKLWKVVEQHLLKNTLGRYVDYSFKYIH